MHYIGIIETMHCQLKGTRDVNKSERFTKIARTVCQLIVGFSSSSSAGGLLVLDMYSRCSVASSSPLVEIFASIAAIVVRRLYDYFPLQKFL